MSSGIAHDSAVVEHRHRQVLRGRVMPNGIVGVVDEQMTWLADEAQQVRGVAAAGALDVVGVDGPAGDRGDRVLELARLVEAVGVERHRDVVGVGERSARSMSSGYAPLSSWTLKPDGARLDERIEVSLVGSSRARPACRC